MPPRAVVLALAVAALTPLGLHAQSVGASFGVRAGATFPTGDAQDAFETGYHLGVSLGLDSPILPVGLRLDATLDQLALSPEAGPAVDSEDLRVISGTVEALYQLPLPFTPYAIGGVGVYSVRDPRVSGDQNEFGWNLGAGIRIQLADFSTFVELRYHRFDASGGEIAFLPVTIGMRF